MTIRFFLSKTLLPPLMSALAIVGGLTMAAPAWGQGCEDGGQKVSICHADGGGFRTLKVSQCAVQSHLANHGDFLGACESNCNIGTTCDDGNACTSDACNPSTGECLHSPVDCDDGDPCTAESCDAAAGCETSPLPGGVCDDGDPCSSGDTCTATGNCRGIPIQGCCQANADCDDGNPCTLDACDASTQTCRRNQTICEDGNPCTVDICNPQTGACESTPAVCEPGFSCNPATGTCVPAAERCGDGLDNDGDGIVDDGCIGDRAWNDLNLNAIQDAGEPGLAGVTFRLFTDDGTLVASTVSNANGIYHFSDVPAGMYFIEAPPPPGYFATPSNAGGDDTLDSDFSGGNNTTPIFTFPADGSIDHLDAGFNLAFSD